MTKERALELLKIEFECVRRGSGMVKEDERWNKRYSECDRDCAKCSLVQESEDLLEMYETVIGIVEKSA